MKVRETGRVGAVTLVASVLVVALLVAGGFAAQSLWARGSLNAIICDGDCGPSAIATPDALGRGSAPGDYAARDADVSHPDGTAVEAAVRSALGDEDLGSHVGFAAVDPADGTVVGSLGSGAYVPASTTKLLTGITALAAIGPQRRFSTRVVSEGDRLVLVGGGDPYLVTKLPRKPVYAVKADLTTLARRTADALERDGTTSVQLAYDASLFTGPDVNPAWEPSYIPQDVVTRVSALWTDQGVVGTRRVDDPAASAARVFAGLLEDRGIDVSGEPEAAEAADGASEIAAVDSATVAQIVEAVIARSDNEGAEVLLRQAAIAAGRPATFDGGVRTVEASLDDLGVDVSDLELHDGSGLSRQNRIAPRTLAGVLAQAAADHQTAGLDSDLAVGGFSGTLARRFSKADDGRGAVRGKSGTLTGVHSLAGYVTDRSGTPIVFAVMTDRTKSINPFVTEFALDRVAAALADCDCTAG